MVAKERSCAVVWVVIEVAVVDIVGGGGGDELLGKRREMVGSKTPNSLGPNKKIAIHILSKSETEDLRCSSNVIENKAAKALHTSPTAAACDSIIEPSCIAGLIFAKNSINPGMRSRTHCRSVGLPEEEASINVLAQ